MLIRVLRRRADVRLAERTRDLLEADAAAINDVIRLELELGCRTEGEVLTLRRRLTGVTIFPVGKSTWQSASDIGFHLRRKGLVVAVPDLLIATTAITLDLVLVHYDNAFDNIADHTDLRVESYAKATL